MSLAGDSSVKIAATPVENTASMSRLALDSTIKLSNGHLPRLGLGVYQSRGHDCYEAVRCAIEAGYKHIDTAQAYRNEDIVGKAISSTSTPRSSLFITTKYMPSHTPQSTEDVYTVLRKSLKQLHKTATPAFASSNPYLRPDPEEEEAKRKAEYVDLFLIHAPFGGEKGRAANWAALARAKEEGWANDIGVSNFGVKHLESLPSPRPAVNQIELHPWCQQREIVEYCLVHGIAIQAYSPLVRGDAKRFEDPVVQRICEKTGKGPGQVLIRWSLQKGYAPLPKSVTPARIQSNADVYDFELDAEDMAALDGLDQGAKGACTWNPVDVE